MKRAKTFSLFATTLVLVLAAAPDAAAQSRCGAREKIVAHLATKYGEQQRSVGIQGRGEVIEIYTNPESGTWTIILTNARGLSCLMAAGEAFQQLTPKPAETPA